MKNIRYEVNDLLTNNKYDFECFICLHDVDNDLFTVQLHNQTFYTTKCDCNGLVHTGCLEKWICINNSCPICRVPVDKIHKNQNCILLIKLVMIVIIMSIVALLVLFIIASHEVME